jgi:riboflavin kinase/FMN adenylyltransferase
VGELSHPAVTNIGRRPTFDDGAPSIETHILDFDADLYDRELRIELLDRLRGEQKFSGVPELVAQIRRDVDDARAYFAPKP